MTAANRPATPAHAAGDRPARAGAIPAGRRSGSTGSTGFRRHAAPGSGGRATVG